MVVWKRGQGKVRAAKKKLTRVWRVSVNVGVNMGVNVGATQTVLGHFHFSVFDFKEVD
jgi:hypothetical protein